MQCSCKEIFWSPECTTVFQIYLISLGWNNGRYIKNLFAKNDTGHFWKKQETVGGTLSESKIQIMLKTMVPTSQLVFWVLSEKHMV